jgi:hypothetical protein
MFLRTGLWVVIGYKLVAFEGRRKLILGSLFTCGLSDIGGCLKPDYFYAVTQTIPTHRGLYAFGRFSSIYFYQVHTHNDSAYQVTTTALQCINS